ncbi:MAG: HAD-IA family hydrolase [Thiolinea sp.]
MPEKLIVRNWEQFRRYLEDTGDQFTVVSFDIFDTLLARIETPEQVQRAVCRLLAKELDGEYTLEQIWQSRQQAETTLREQAQIEGLDYECRFSELVPCWLKLLTGESDTGLLDFILQTELELEKQALYVKAGAKDLLQWLSGRSCKMYAVSDMYLDGQYIKELLADKKLLAYFDQVYVSADTALCKYSGRLFQHIRDVQGISFQQWLHIGDNPVSDRRAACQLGIQGIWLYEKQELKRREQQQLSVAMAARGGLWKGQHFFSVLQQQLNVSTPGQESEAGFYFRYGRDVLGGAFSTFTLGLHERLQRKPVSKVLFVARDGFLFREMYHHFAERLDDEYVYLSRKVITAASTADGLNLEQAQVAFYNPKQQGLKSVCRVYGLPETELAELAVRHGFDDFSAPITDWQDKRLQSFLADERVQNCIRPVGEQHRQFLEGYLQQVGFFGAESIALVDIGWNGTVQKFLKQAFGERVDFPRVHGYYFAFVPKMYNDFGRNNFCEGIIHDSRRDNACERIPAEFEEIFEQGARAQGATTIAYQQAGNLIEPVFKPDSAPDRKAELACNPIVAEIQRGVLQHWQHFLLVQRLTGYSSIDLLPYVYGQLERAIVYPSREESQMLTRLVHTEDFGDDHVLDLGKEALGWRDLLHPGQLWQRLRDAAWRYALFAGIPTGIANFAFRMVYLHAVKK